MTKAHLQKGGGLLNSVGKLKSFGHFGIPFPIGLAAHGKVHAYLGALTGEIGL
jgi:hypothetical protein